MNDLFLQNLLTENKRAPNGKLVADVTDGELGPTGNNLSADNVEEQSTMEMMMAAYQQAKSEKVSAADEEVKRTTKTFGGGFKKGFFGGGGNEKKISSSCSKKIVERTEKDAYLSWMQHDVSSNSVKNAIDKGGSSALDNSCNKSASDVGVIPTIRKNNQSASSHTVTESLSADVQQAMIDQEPQMIKQLKEGVFQKNDVIRNGLKNARCTAALQMMQSDPKEAKKRFEGDPEVDLFMREFGKVMSLHFNELSETQSKEKVSKESRENTTCSSSSSSRHDGKNGKLITEETVSSSKHDKRTSYGVLQEDAIERNRLNSSGSAVTALKGAAVVDAQREEELEAKRVREIVSDTELSALLLDPDFQQVLKDCNDPLKYHMHMSNPATAKKIQKMFNAGLVAKTN